MSVDASKVTIHMVSSLNGFIAKTNGDVSWLESSDVYEKGIALSEHDVEEFVKAIDCYVMGSKTFEHALELGWPYGKTPVVVLTHRKLPTTRENVEFYAGDLNKLVNELKHHYRNIWVVGGATVVKDFTSGQLADDIIISILPIIIANGVPFFDQIDREQKLHLKDVTAYRDGMVELWYEVLKE